MRIAGPDIVLFVVGAVLFAGATYAIVATDGSGGAGSALGVFTVTFAPEIEEVGSEDVASMRAASLEFDVNASRVLSVIVLVSCQEAAPVPVPFAIQVDVAGPNGLTGTGSGNCGTDITVIVDVGESAPERTTVAGSNEAEARANLDAGDASAASGTWTVDISGARAQQSPLPVPVVEPGGSVTLSVETYAPTFSPVQR